MSEVTTSLVELLEYPVTFPVCELKYCLAPDETGSVINTLAPMLKFLSALSTFAGASKLLTSE